MSPTSFVASTELPVVRTVEKKSKKRKNTLLKAVDDLGKDSLSSLDMTPRQKNKKAKTIRYSTKPHLLDVYPFAGAYRLDETHINLIPPPKFYSSAPISCSSGKDKMKLRDNSSKVNSSIEYSFPPSFIKPEVADERIQKIIFNILIEAVGSDVFPWLDKTESHCDSFMDLVSDLGRIINPDTGDMLDSNAIKNRIFKNWLPTSS